MATPFSLSGLLVYPPDDGQPNASRDLSGSGSFSSKVEAELNLVAPGTTVVGMGTIANARVVLVEVGVLASNPAPINVRLNGGTDDIEISPGGSWLYYNPTPTNGISAISVTNTDSKRVKVTILE
jgi:hypothetical protein